MIDHGQFFGSAALELGQLYLQLPLFFRLLEQDMLDLITALYDLPRLLQRQPNIFLILLQFLHDRGDSCGLLKALLEGLAVDIEELDGHIGHLRHAFLVLILSLTNVRGVLLLIVEQLEALAQQGLLGRQVGQEAMLDDHLSQLDQCVVLQRALKGRRVRPVLVELLVERVPVKTIRARSRFRAPRIRLASTGLVLRRPIISYHVIRGGGWLITTAGVNLASGPGRDNLQGGHCQCCKE